METIAKAAYQIPTANLDRLRAKVEKLGRRCEKLGLPVLTLLSHRTDERVRYESWDRNGRQITPPLRKVLPCTWVELSGAMPILEGYLFLARIEHTPAGNMVTSPRTDMLGPSYDLTSYRDAKPICEHCKISRMRKDTFVLRTPEGNLIQIGRNCLADFIRSDNADVACDMLALTELLNRMSDETDESDDWGGGWGGGGYYAATATKDFVAASVAAVRKDGFRPSSFDGNSTKSRASFLCGECPKGDSYASQLARADWIAGQPTDEDRAKAEVVIAWVKEQTDPSDYMHNLRIACALASVSARHEGILASAVSAYERAQGREAIRKAEKSTTAESEFQGEVKKRQVWTLTVLRKASWDSDFGHCVLHIMTDAGGNCFTWKMTGNKDSLDIGKTYQIKGTVKKHETYKGTKQTVLTRCAVEGE